MGYNCGLEIGKTRVRVREYRHEGEEGVTWETPELLIGIEGIVENVDNGHYDADRPTGFERVEIQVRPTDRPLSDIHPFYHDEVFTDCLRGADWLSILGSQS
jgi:hypothetical protein